MPAPPELLSRVPLFHGFERKQLERLAQSFKQRRFSAGDTVAEEGQRGVGFFVIESGEASVTRGDQQLSTLGAGDYFGEIALIDDGPRTATVKAKSDMVCYGLTSWEFRPLVEDNSEIAWQLLQVMAQRLRAAQSGT